MTSLQCKGFLFSLDRSSPYFPTYLRVQLQKNEKKGIHTIRIQISRNRHRAIIVFYWIAVLGILIIFRLKKHLSLDLHFKFSKLKAILSYVELKTFSKYVWLPFLVCCRKITYSRTFSPPFGMNSLKLFYSTV